MTLFAFACLLPAIAYGAGPQPGDSWRELGFLNIGRAGCKAHSIDGHRVIVIGGWGDESGPADSSAEILDTTTGDWTFTAPLPDGFAPGAIPWTARLSNEFFLAAGGFNAFLETGDMRSYIYSVSGDNWIRTGDLPLGSTLVSNFSQTNSVLLDDGRVLIAGGLTLGVGESNASMVFTPNYSNLRAGATGDAAGTWDFTRDSKGNITKLNSASEHHKLIKLADGRALIIHGSDHRYANGKWGAVDRDTHGVQAELFDPKTGKWTALPNLPAISGEDDRHNGVKGVRQQAAVALLKDGRVLVSGGISEPADERGKPLLKDLYYVRASAVLFDSAKFDSNSYPWSITGSMHIARESHAMGALPGNAGILASWGWTRADWTASAEIFDPTVGSWRLVAGLPAAAETDLAISLPWGCSTMMPNGDMLITGGAEDLEFGGTSRRTYRYHP